MASPLIRSEVFDRFLIWLPCAAALAFGLSVYGLSPSTHVFSIAMCLTGFGHVWALFNRLYGNSDLRKRHWILAWPLPPLCLLTVAVAFHFSPKAVFVGYVFGRFFHYVRQSYGISRILGKNLANGRLHEAWIYLLPSIFFAVVVLEHPQELTNFALVLLGLGLLALLWRLSRAESVAQKFHLTYLWTHLLMFALGYLFFQRSGAGHLMLVVWHGSQYMLFVWHCQNLSRNKNPLSAKPAFFAAIVVGLGTATFGLLKFSDQNLYPHSFLIVGMAINLHHYVVDGFIWRRSNRTCE